MRPRCHRCGSDFMAVIPAVVERIERVSPDELIVHHDEVRYCRGCWVDLRAEAVLERITGA